MNRFDRQTLIALLSIGLLASLPACDKGKGGVQLPDKPPTAATAAPGVDGPEGGDSATRPAPAVAAAPRKVTVTGTTSAHRSSTLRSKVTGLVDKVHVLDGQAVEAGDLIVSLDTSDLELHLAAAKAALRFAQAQQKAVRIEAERAKRLVADKALPKAQQEQASAQLDVATAGVGQARVAIKMASKAIADAEIKAPYDSVIVMRHVAEGDYAAAMPPQPIVTLQEVDPIDIRMMVPAVHQALVRAGGSVKIRFPHSGLERDGTIDRIVPAIDPRNRSLSAIIVLPNPDRALFPGMFAEVELATTPTAGDAPAAPATPAPTEAKRAENGQ